MVTPVTSVMGNRSLHSVLRSSGPVWQADQHLSLGPSTVLKRGCTWQRLLVNINQLGFLCKWPIHSFCKLLLLRQCIYAYVSCKRSFEWGVSVVGQQEGAHVQAIEAAIELGLSRVEAGAQGEHKIQRGYLPSLTYSSHYIRDARVSAAIEDFLRRERYQVMYTMDSIRQQASPFKAPAAAKL